jgi:hypothetical protein
VLHEFHILVVRDFVDWYNIGEELEQLQYYLFADELNEH